MASTEIHDIDFCRRHIYGPLVALTLRIPPLLRVNYLWGEPSLAGKGGHNSKSATMKYFLAEHIKKEGKRRLLHDGKI